MLLETGDPTLSPLTTDVPCARVEMLLRTRGAAAWRVAAVFSVEDITQATGINLTPRPTPPNPADPNAPGSP